METKTRQGVFLTDLSKAFDCILRNRHFVNLHAYLVDKDALTFLYSYLKRRKKCVKINSMQSYFRGTSRSILGSLLYNIFLNDLFLFVKKNRLAGDNTISAFRKGLDPLIHIVAEESENTISYGLIIKT